MMLIKYCDDDQNGIHTKLTKIFANFICGGLLANSAHKDLLGLTLPAPERGNTSLLIMGSNLFFGVAGLGSIAFPSKR